MRCVWRAGHPLTFLGRWPTGHKDDLPGVPPGPYTVDAALAVGDVPVQGRAGAPARRPDHGSSLAVAHGGRRPAAGENPAHRSPRATWRPSDTRQVPVATSWPTTGTRMRCRGGSRP